MPAERQRFTALAPIAVDPLKAVALGWRPLPLAFSTGPIAFATPTHGQIRLAVAGRAGDGSRTGAGPAPAR
ncbi:hypothetical protein STPYR_10329 [uncultured Stenotrophomonas sp.]|uniref:Uncharacterized protein n=1 Tax=uncultured Stenotrophomonas sp. TaxID=165438 RepID=A0A1Y5PZH7_9GAMM|nr:hypothetical protein STPYR_10329 [uncultured Stenotrophomonas sp.]